MVIRWQRQRVSRLAEKRTYEANDGNWYSYDGMGPISDFIALVVTIGDHQDSKKKTTWKLSLQARFHAQLFDYL